MLTQELCNKIEQQIFKHETTPDNFNFNDSDIKEEQKKLILNIELYMKHVFNDISVESKEIECFVNDVINLIHILREPIHMDSNLRRDQLIDELGKFLIKSRKPSCSHLPQLSNPRWQQYIRGLIDAIFGLWSDPGQGLYHLDNTDSSRFCIESFLLTATLERRSPSDASYIDPTMFDAAFIEAYGPFRFKRADNLDQHLEIRNYEILIYTDWKKWARIRRHTVLRNRSSFTNFDLLTSLL